VIGSYIWTVGIISAGYVLGERLEGSLDKYLLPIVGLIVAASLTPIVLEVLRDRRDKRVTDQDR
jgi:membrane-associated protein